MAKVGSELWEIELADGWEVQSVDECVTICHPDGVGALQVSGYTKRTTGEVTRGDLLAATKLDAVVQEHLGEQTWGEFRGFQLVYGQGPHFWRKWWLSNENVLLFVTYNCDRKHEDLELQDVNQMVGSLRRPCEQPED